MRFNDQTTKNAIKTLTTLKIFEAFREKKVFKAMKATSQKVQHLIRFIYASQASNDKVINETR